MRILVLSTLWLLASSTWAADNWCEFRGPGGRGHAADAELPLEWSEQENITWKTEIHGKGWSSPVVWEDQVWMTTATEDGKQMYAVCVDLNSGEILHDILVFENATPRFCHATNSYASPTPVVEAGRVYVHFGSYGTACLDTSTGSILWTRRDLPCNHWRGPGSSPIVYKDLLIVAFDGYDLQYIVAFDKDSGKTVWQKDRNIDYGTNNGDRKKAYCTATVIEHEGRLELISPSAVETISYDPATGTELWRVRHGGMNAACRPIYGQGLVYIAAGDGAKELIAVRPGGNGDVTNSHVAWSTSKSIPRRPTQLLVDDLLFMISDDGVASCVEATSGEILWQKRVPGKYRASPIYANGHVYLCSLEGHCLVLEAGREYKLLQTNMLDNGFQSSPAVSGNSLLLRSTQHLYRIDGR